MGFIITILLGALVGWLASIVMHRNAEQGALQNILVGIGGAILGNLIVSLLDGRPGLNFGIQLNLWSIFVAFLGALALCAILNYSKRKKLR